VRSVLPESSTSTSSANAALAMHSPIPRRFVLRDDDHGKRIVRAHVVGGRGRGSAILAAA
jgi:hypothetical protein